MKIWRVFRQGLIVGIHDFQEFWNWRTWFGGWMLRILTNACAWVLLGKLLQSQEKLEYLLVGNAVAAGATASLWASNSVSWNRYDGTHTLQVIAPGSLLPAAMGRSAVWLLNGVFTSLTTLLVLLVGFGYRPATPGAWLVPLVVMVICTSVYCFALFLGSLVSLNTKLRNPVLDISSTLFMAFCGVSVPVGFWPEPIPTLVQLLPLTHGLAGVRALVTGAPLTVAAQAVTLELLVGAAWLVVSLLCMDRLAEAGRADGSIEFT
ncbi:MAG: hypothetical protein RL033_6788 [Pseudomonadota bacterium]|jgi:ABC-2 type transport system permease protein